MRQSLEEQTEAKAVTADVFAHEHMAPETSGACGMPLAHDYRELWKQPVPWCTTTEQVHRHAAMKYDRSHLCEVFHLQKVFQDDMALVKDSVCWRLLGVCAHSPEHLIATFPNSRIAQGHRGLCICGYLSEACVNMTTWYPLGLQMHNEVRKWP